MRSFLAGPAVLAGLAVFASAADPQHFEDAALRALQFIDANEGWAAGDEGAIWHTIDGGRNWERQPSGVRASLRAVHFLTPFTGWVVGREELAHGSAGVILLTRAGGLKWQQLGLNALPGLHCVRFFDDKFGIVAGDGSAQFPGGTFTTNDGGRSWKPLAGPRSPGWRASDFLDAQYGALAGAWSRLAAVRQGTPTAADIDTLGGRSLHGIRLLGKQAVAVGQGGLVLVSTESSGLRWGFADLKLPTEVRACLDFHAVAGHGEHVWVVGRPGSIVMHSPDRGQTWDVQQTGQALPLHAVHFLNEQKGWAAGELGTILTTSDGGKSWTVQRQGGARAAVLFVHARATGVPLEAISMLGGQDGYLTAALRVTAAEPASAPPEQARDPERLTRAMRLAAGAAAETLWQFPVPDHVSPGDKPTLIAGWDRLHADRAGEQMLRQLVLALRIWQPEVVVTDSPAQSALEELVADALREAFQRAGDPQAFSEQIEVLGLKPWKARKLYCACAASLAAVRLDFRVVQPVLRKTAQEFAGTARRLLDPSPSPLPSEGGEGRVRGTQAGYRLLASHLAGADAQRSLMQGITLAQGGTARRTQVVSQDTPDQDEEKAIARGRRLQVIAQTPVAGLTDPNKVLAQIGPALANLPAEHGASAAFAIARQFADAGQWLLAREAFLLLVDRYPAHPLSAEGYRWLIRHNCSSEARRRHELGQFLVTTQLEIRQSPKEQGSDPIRGGAEYVRKNRLQLLGELGQTRRWYEGALEVEPRLAAFGPLFGSEPAMQFCLRAAQRSLGKFDDARAWYTSFLRSGPEGAWRAAAAAELWLVNRTGQPPKPVAWCRPAVNRPSLDGSFDDPCWQGTPVVKLRNAAGDTAKDYPTEAWLAYDKDFLYLAVRCQHPEGFHVSPVKVRPRDADLQNFDRVGLLLDLDRDYNTYYQLHIDQRGCLCEDCWGDCHWNPRWFVAIRSDATSWQVEVAIPLIELTGDGLTAGRAWAFNLVRTLPGRGVQAWSLPAGVQPRPEGMGLVLFSGEANKQAPKAPTTTGR